MATISQNGSTVHLLLMGTHDIHLTNTTTDEPPRHTTQTTKAASWRSGIEVTLDVMTHRSHGQYPRYTSARKSRLCEAYNAPKTYATKYAHHAPLTLSIIRWLHNVQALSSRLHGLHRTDPILGAPSPCISCTSDFPMFLALYSVSTHS